MVVDGLADPLFGATYHFQQNARYQFNFNTDGSGAPNATIYFTFSTFGNGPTCPAPGAACQTYSATFPDGTVVNGTVTPGTEGTAHVDPTPFIATSGDKKVFAGPRENPFFFDFVGFNRSIAAGNLHYTGLDAFKGKNAMAIVVEFPLATVFPAGACVSSNPALPLASCGVWASTFLGISTGSTPAYLRQVERMGNPLVAELLPLSSRDNFNASLPMADSSIYGPMLVNQILTIDKSFGTCPQDTTDPASCNPNVPLLASLEVPDMLRFASNVGDGYPNGRRASDRASDLLTILILQTNKLPISQPFTDGTSVKQQCPIFPFLGPPLQLNDGTIPPVQPNPLPCP
jgi:hypothetical protein